MASLKIKHMPEDLYESLKLSAPKDHRTLAHQVIVLLREGLTTRDCKSFRRIDTSRIDALRKIRLYKVETKPRDISFVNMIHYDRRR